MQNYLVEWGKCCNFVGDFCMLSPLKHIICISLLVFLMGNFVSCQSWREAKEVIAKADSMQGTKIDTNTKQYAKIE
jgi:hypothetical protein